MESCPAAFIYACKAGQTDVLGRMLKESPDLVNCRSEHDMPAIVHAVCANRMEVVDLLIASGGDIEAKDAHYKAAALGFAAWHGHADIARLLVKR